MAFTSSRIEMRVLDHLKARPVQHETLTATVDLIIISHITPSEFQTDRKILFLVIEHARCLTKASPKMSQHRAASPHPPSSRTGPNADSPVSELVPRKCSLRPISSAMDLFRSCALSEPAEPFHQTPPVFPLSVSFSTPQWPGN